LEDSHIEILDVRKRYRFDLSPALAIRKAITTCAVDVVVSYLNTPNLYSMMATIGSRAKVIVSERSMFEDGRLPLSTWVRYQAYRLADAITVNTEHQKDRVITSFPWSRSKLSVIWNGVDLDKYSPCMPARIPDSAEIRLIAAATIVPSKNAYNLIKALRLAIDQGIRLKIDWVGKVEQSGRGREEFDRCQALVEQLGLGDAWQWLGMCHNMHQLYRKYDALIHPSVLEGLPNAVCEGLASGLVILASNIGDNPLLVLDGVNGWLFDPDNPDSIAGALLRLARLSATQRQSISCASREMAVQNLGLDRFIESCEDQLLRTCQN